MPSRAVQVDCEHNKGFTINSSLLLVRPTIAKKEEKYLKYSLNKSEIEQDTPFRHHSLPLCPPAG